jgi:hypothetical protein
MGKKTKITSKDLRDCAKAASTQAVRNAKASNVPYTVQEGRRIVQHQSDGSKTVVGQLNKAYAKPAGKRYKVA